MYPRSILDRPGTSHPTIIQVDLAFLLNTFPPAIFLLGGTPPPFLGRIPPLLLEDTPLLLPCATRSPPESCCLLLLETSFIRLADLVCLYIFDSSSVSNDSALAKTENRKAFKEEISWAILAYYTNYFLC